MNQTAFSRSLAICAATFLTSMSFGQTRLSMLTAVQMAKKYNGTLRAAQADIDAARARSSQAKSAFLPTLTPSVTFTDSLREIANAQFGTQSLEFRETQAQAQFSWTLLDSGQRLSRLRATRADESGTVANARQTVRQIIFNVEQQFLETLRAQELEKVAQIQLERSEKVLAQTEARVKVGDVARREVLQAQADALNARVNVITAKNRSATNAINLSASIRSDTNAYSLEFHAPILVDALPKSSDEVVKFGLANRPDLAGFRNTNKSLEQNVIAAKIDQGLTYAVDLSYNRQFSPAIADNRTLLASVSFPLFDGGLRKAVVKEREATLTASQLRYTQSESDARGEIKSAYITNEQNLSRLEAAELAVKAARLNFESATESRKVGASNLIDVITAQVSLVTAEANYIEATYDSLISQYRLRLVTGLPLLGEDE
jgi:outer membrane protein